MPGPKPGVLPLTPPGNPIGRALPSKQRLSQLVGSAHATLQRPHAKRMWTRPSITGGRGLSFPPRRHRSVEQESPLLNQPALDTVASASASIRPRQTAPLCLGRSAHRGSEVDDLSEDGCPRQGLHMTGCDWETRTRGPSAQACSSFGRLGAGGRDRKCSLVAEQ